MTRKLRDDLLFGHKISPERIGRVCQLSVAATLVLCSSTSLRAETNAQLAAEIKALKAELNDMNAAIAATSRNTRKARAAAARTSAPVAVPEPAGGPIIPAGASPVFVTSDKKLQFGAITITPGGYFAAESVFRARTTQSDINTDYRSIPFGNSPLAHVNEYRFSARQTRPALLAEGYITPTFVAAGYLELDFQGAPNTANSNEANGFAPRIRNLYATLDNADYGLHVLAGQSWSLTTLNSQGITPRNEVTPPTIESSYVPGFVYARQPGIRLTKDFDRKLWLSVAAEQSQTTFANGCAVAATAPGTAATTATQGVANGGVNGNFGNGNTISTAGGGGIACGATGTGGGLAGDTNVFSLNHVPDVIGKAAYELLIGERDLHFEAFGVYKDLYDRVAYTNNLGIAQNTNRDTTGYGVGAGFIVPIIPRRLDFQVSGLYGRGIGRYGTGQLPDTTLNADGSLRPIQEGMLLGGVIAHATPAIDIYAFSGIEREFRNYNQNYTAGVANGSFYGAGAPGAVTANVQGCNLEPNAAAQYNPVGACTSTASGNTKQIFQVTAGLWDKIYKGSFGEVRVGVQYSFTERQIYNNVPGVTAPGGTGALVYTNNYQPKASDNIIFTSLRYYPFL